MDISPIKDPKQFLADVKALVLWDVHPCSSDSRILWMTNRPDEIETAKLYFCGAELEVDEDGDVLVTFTNSATSGPYFCDCFLLGSSDKPDLIAEAVEAYLRCVHRDTVKTMVRPRERTHIKDEDAWVKDVLKLAPEYDWEDEVLKDGSRVIYGWGAGLTRLTLDTSDDYGLTFAWSKINGSIEFKVVLEEHHTPELVATIIRTLKSMCTLKTELPLAEYLRQLKS